MLPPWARALPQYHRPVSVPRALPVFSRHRSVRMIVPAGTTCGRPSATALSRASRRSGAWADRTAVTSSRCRQAVAREMPWSRASASGLV